jgi:hypothetical protein
MKLDNTSRASSRVLVCALPRQTHWHLLAWTGQTCGRARHRRSALALAAVIRWSRLKGSYYPDPVIGQDPASDERSQAGAALRLPTLTGDSSRYEPKETVMDPLRRIRRIAVALAGVACACLAVAVSSHAAFAQALGSPGGGMPAGWGP